MTPYSKKIRNKLFQFSIKFDKIEVMYFNINANIDQIISTVRTYVSSG